MAGVINDIDALAEFRSHLMQFNRELEENFATIRGHWQELGEVWRDDMYRKFGEALEEVTPGIEHYLSATEGHEAHLSALIDRLRAYLDTGLAASGSEGGRRSDGGRRSEGGRRSDGGQREGRRDQDPR